MTKKIALFLLTICLPFLTVSAQLTDSKSSLQTKNLYKNLTKLFGKKVFFGHQDDLAYGVGWKYEKDRSDIKSLTTEYPAVFGWEVAGLEQNQKMNIDGVPFENIKQYARKAYDMGAINTISWHMDNPLNGKSAWDTTANTLSAILPGGSAHQVYKNFLNKFAVFVKDLKGTDGKAIPILFRPFHEHTGSWFWWGKKQSTPHQYVALWKFTVHYLRDVKGLHQLLYVYNPSDFKNEAEYLERYPGDNYVDILSFDDYQYGPVTSGEKYVKELSNKLAIQHKISLTHHKIAAIAEMGYVEIPDPQWWTNVVIKAIEKYKPSYILVWRNAGYREKEKDNHYYGPYPGQTSAKDFLSVYQEQKILLQKGIEKYAIYK